jgi:hypothetical protein
MAKSLYARRQLFAMRQSIIDGAPDTAAGLAQQAVSSGIAPIDAINLGAPARGRVTFRLRAALLAARVRAGISRLRASGS